MLVLQAGAKLGILDWGPRLNHHIDLQFKKKSAHIHIYVCMYVFVY